MEAELGKARASLRRMNAALRQRPFRPERRSDACDPLIDTYPEDRLGRMAGGLIDDNRAEAAVRGDVPERFGGAAAAARAPPVAADRIGLAVGEDPMAIGSHAGNNGRPGKRRNRRSNTDALPDRPGGDQARKRRQLPGVEERMDDFPVGRIPADQKHAFTGGSHSGETFGVIVTAARGKTSPRAAVEPTIQSRDQAARA